MEGVMKCVGGGLESETLAALKGLFFESNPSAVA
jgi:hypothetical protein